MMTEYSVQCAEIDSPLLEFFLETHCSKIYGIIGTVFVMMILPAAAENYPGTDLLNS